MKNYRVLLAVLAIFLLSGCATRGGTFSNFMGMPSTVKVAPNIYIGNWNDARDVKALREHGIDAILNVGIEIDDPAIPGITRAKAGIVDSEDENNQIKLKLAVDLLDRWIKGKHTVMVHCILGQNRTPWVVSHYLAMKNGSCWTDEFAKIKKKRPEVYIKDWMSAYP